MVSTSSPDKPSKSEVDLIISSFFIFILGAIYYNRRIGLGFTRSSDRFGVAEMLGDPFIIVVAGQVKKNNYDRSQKNNPYRYGCLLRFGRTTGRSGACRQTINCRRPTRLPGS